MAKLLHLRISIADVLRSTDAELERELSDFSTDFTVPQLRTWLTQQVDAGKRYLRLDGECDNFSAEHGCMGHELNGVSA